MDTKLLHDIDKRLAVLEAMNKQHAKDTLLEMHDLSKDIKAIRNDVDNMKIKVAGSAGAISIIVGVVFKWFSM
jgi:hypothetical protein